MEFFDQLELIQESVATLLQSLMSISYRQVQILAILSATLCVLAMCTSIGSVIGYRSCKRDISQYTLPLNQWC